MKYACAILRGDRDGVVRSLEGISVDPATVRKIVVEPGATVLATGAIHGLCSLESVILPDSLIEIERRAIRDCQQLASLFCPASLRFVAPEAVSECPQIKCSTLVRQLGGWSPAVLPELHRMGLLRVSSQIWHHISQSSECTEADRAYALRQLLAVA